MSPPQNRGAKGAEWRASKARESRSKKRRVGCGLWSMLKGYAPPHPTRGLGSVVSSPSGFRAELRPETHFGVF